MKQLLKEIAEVSAGQGAPQGDSNYCEDGIPFVKAGNLLELTEGKSIHGIQKVSEAVAKKYRLRLYKKGTILFAKSGMSCLKGYVYVLPCDAYVVSHLACVTPKEDISEYLKYYFCYHRPNQLVKDEAYPSISLSDIGCLEINTQDATYRDMVVTSLRKISSIIEMRKQQLSELDNLVKARFVEMFGDPETNPMGWKRITVQQAINEKVIDKPLDGNHGGKHPKTSDYVPTGVPFIMANNLVDGHVDLEHCAFISKKQADSLDKGFAKDGDVLITHKGTIGRTAILHCSYPYIMLTPQVTYYRPIAGIIPEYLKAYFDTDYFQGIIGNIASVGSTRAYIGITAQQELPLLIPEMEKQKAYASFVKQTDKSKAVVQKALEEAQTLFESLMQQYFG